ncbi:hypothetical protein L9F63_014145, partial [Diploptera punctata]
IRNLNTDGSLNITSDIYIYIFKLKLQWEEKHYETNEPLDQDLFPNRTVLKYVV